MTSQFLRDAPRFMFFTGKGGVGKTSVACATALELASSGQRVLLVSTDPASNIGQVFGVSIGNRITPIPGIASLWALEIDPEEAASAYRERIIGPVRGTIPDTEITMMTEQLSGSCTTEIASFNEFTELVAEPVASSEFDHIVFDTAPTGHTIRLLQLPGSWTDFLNEGKGDASCLGPLAGLEKQRAVYASAVAQLTDPHTTRMVLVTRAQRSSLAEAARTRQELQTISIGCSHLVVNGIMPELAEPQGELADPLVAAIRSREATALEGMPIALAGITIDAIDLKTDNMVGMPALRSLLGGADVRAGVGADAGAGAGAGAGADADVGADAGAGAGADADAGADVAPGGRASSPTHGTHPEHPTHPAHSTYPTHPAHVTHPTHGLHPALATHPAPAPLPTLLTLQALQLSELVDEIERDGKGLVLCMGKGGVGKTTIAAALAVALAGRGHDVTLTTTDPAAHSVETLQSDVASLTVSRIDPESATEAYPQHVLATKGTKLDDVGRAALWEDLQSPCTEEVAVFHQFSRAVHESRNRFVIVDTAPTGHTLLLLDAAGSYHRETARQLGDSMSFITPLMRLQDPVATKLVIVTLAEPTPVTEAAELQRELNFAGITPFAWVINNSLAAATPTNPFLQLRAENKCEQIDIVRSLCARVAVVPMLAEEPVGVRLLARLTLTSQALTAAE